MNGGSSGTPGRRLRVLAIWLVAAGTVFGAGFTVIFLSGLDRLTRVIGTTDAAVNVFLPLGAVTWLVVTVGIVSALMLAVHSRRRGGGVTKPGRVMSAVRDALLWWLVAWLVSLVPMLAIGALLSEQVTRATFAMVLVAGPLVALVLWPFVAELLWPESLRGDDPRANRLVWLWRFLAFKTGKTALAGDVWFAQVPFAEGGGSKDRPVLILGPGDRFTWESMMFTSADKRGRPGYFRSDTLIRGERKSWLKIDRLVHLEPRDLRVRVGPADLETMKAAHSARQRL